MLSKDSWQWCVVLLPVRVVGALVWFGASSLYVPQRQAHAVAKQETQGKVGNVASTKPLVAVPAPKADDRIADYTLWLTVFTGVLGATTVGLFILGLNQGKLIKREFVSMHRPKLRVRNVVIRYPTSTTGRKTTFFENGYPVFGQLYVVNVGNSEAHITDSGCWVEWRATGLPMERPYEGKNGNALVRNVTLKAGQSIPGTFLNDMMDNAGDAIREGKNGWNLWVMGWIEYRDDLHTPRRTIFCRQYFPEEGRHAWTGRFRAVDDPDYEAEE